MSRPGGGREATPHTGSGRQAVEAVWRIESARIVGWLARFTGDFALAEDLAQEALAEALVTWPRAGVPRDPAAWLRTVGRRRAIDAFRRRSALDERYATLARELPEGGATSGSTGTLAGDDDLLWDPDRIDDDVLALMFTACHPVLSRESQVALTLRVLGGLTSDEIGRAFFVPTTTVQARITRAKKTLAAAHVHDLATSGDLSGSHLLPSVRGELLCRLRRFDEARHELERAVHLCGNERERALLRGKLAALPDG